MNTKSDSCTGTKPPRVWGALPEAVPGETSRGDRRLGLGDVVGLAIGGQEVAQSFLLVVVQHSRTQQQRHGQCQQHPDGGQVPNPHTTHHEHSEGDGAEDQRRTEVGLQQHQRKWDAQEAQSHQQPLPVDILGRAEERRHRQDGGQLGQLGRLERSRAHPVPTGGSVHSRPERGSAHRQA
ncbi:MAG: hypothetical protein M5U19_23330 [Microthrixaceae bacterium]|nr:hypothetical protein [Microthrixaceae bacterium]